MPAIDSRRARLARFATLSPIKRAACWAQLPGIVILTYHRVAATAPELDRTLWSATPDSLRGEIAFLQREFEIVSPAQLDEALEAPRGRRAMITFDDGYRDNYELAFPILREAGVPATFFLTSGFIDSPRLSWWDEITWIGRRAGLAQSAIVNRIREYKRLPGARCESFLEAFAAEVGCERPPASAAADTWMTWDMVREMRDAGMSFGAHTVNHPVLANLGREEQEAEVLGSVGRLETELRAEVELFSYPVGAVGDFDTSTREIVRAAGARFGFSNYGGYVRPGQVDRYDLRRTNLTHEMMTPALFESIVRWPQIFARS